MRQSARISSGPGLDFAGLTWQGWYQHSCFFVLTGVTSVLFHKLLRFKTSPETSAKSNLKDEVVFNISLVATATAKGNDSVFHFIFDAQRLCDHA